MAIRPLAVRGGDQDWYVLTLPNAAAERVPTLLLARVPPGYEHPFLTAGLLPQGVPSPGVPPPPAVPFPRDAYVPGSVPPQRQ